MRTTGSIRALTVCIVVIATWTSSVRAEHNSNYIFNAATTNFGGALSIPMTSPGTNNALVISNGGSVTNTAGTIGPNGGDNFNFAIVTNSGSLWFNSGELWIGGSGNSNQLVIADSGLVIANGASFIGRNSGSIGNSALVTGSGSVLRFNNSLAIGNNGRSHSLSVESGGFVSVSNSSITVGVDGHKNRVVVSGGGDIVTLDGVIGLRSGVTNNTVLLTDNGSSWIVNRGFDLGGPSGPASYNQVIVSNGAQFIVKGAGGNFLVGGNAGSSNNAVIVNGSLSYLEMGGSFNVIGNHGLNNSLVVDGGTAVATNGSFTIGGSGRGTAVVVSNGGRLVSYANSTAIGGSASSSNNSILVTGNGSVWSNRNELSFSSSAGNQLTIAAGGMLINGDSSLGHFAGSTDNAVLVTGTNSTWISGGQNAVGRSFGRNTLTVTDGGQVIVTNHPAYALSDHTLYVGVDSSDNRMIISSGGKVSSVDGTVGLRSSVTNNVVTITGSNSSWTINRNFTLGGGGSPASFNRVVVTNGGQFITDAGGGNVLVGQHASSFSNSVTVTGTGSLWRSRGDIAIGNVGHWNSLTVSDGGAVQATNNTIYAGVDGHNSRILVSGGGQVASKFLEIGLRSSVTNNVVVLSDSGTTWNISGGLGMGGGGGPSSHNQLIISNGAQLVTVGAGGNVLIGQHAGSSNNTVLVSGTGSLAQFGLSGNFFVVGNNGPNNGITVANGGKMVVTNGAFIVGGSGANASLTITNGGQVFGSSGLTVGNVASSTGNRIRIHGAGSLLRLAGTATVGGSGTGQILVEDAGTLEAPTLATGASAANTISNRAGIYQFATAGPTVTPGAAGSIMLTNGTISFRAVTAAPTAPIANLSYQGNNAFRLNNATNANPGSYKFDSIANTANPANYQRLSLINNSRWISTYLTNGIGGAIQGGAGDVVEVGRNFIIERPSNSLAEFNLASSTVLFSGGVGHTNAITGDDFGHSATLGNPDGFTAENFAYGKLSISSASDTICFSCGESPVAPSNALYVTWLDLLGSTNNVANLHSPSTINIYYLNSEPNNAYLGNNVFQLTDCDGVTTGGLLMPAVPEPSAFVLFGTVALLLWRRRLGTDPGPTNHMTSRSRTR